MSKQRKIFYESYPYNSYKNVSDFYFIQVIRPVKDIHILRMQDKQSIEIEIYKKVILYLKKISFILVV